MIKLCRLFLILIFSIQSFGIQADNQTTRLSIAYGLENYNFDSVLSQFSKETGIEIDISPFKNNDLKAELIQRSKVAQLPDAVIVPADFTGLSEIRFSEVPESLLSTELTTSAKNSSKLNDKYYGVPIIAGNHLILFYNKSIIENPAPSWQELIKQQQQLPKDKTLITWSYHEMYWFIPFVGAFNEFPFVNGQLNFRTAGMKKALAWYHSLSTENIVDKNCDYNCSVESFTSGQAAYSINGTWALNLYRNALGTDLGIAILPSYQNRPMRPYFSSHVIAFPDNSLQGEHAQALTKLATYFQRKDVQRKVWLHMRSLPVHKTIMSEILSTDEQQISVMLQQLESSEPLPIERDMAIVWEAMLKGVNRYHAGVFDVDKATEYMHYIATKSMQNDNN